MEISISSWGNSQGMRLPKSVLKELSLSIGDKLNLFVEKNQIILKPVKKEKIKFNISDLVKQMPKNYKPQEEFDNKTGIEEW
jgi:antitoxin MazE